MTPEDKIEIVAAFVDETAAPMEALSARLEKLKAAIDQLNGTMAEMGNAAGKGVAKTVTAFDALQTKLNTFGSAAKEVGTSLTTSVSLPIAAISGVAVKMAATFQQQMEILHTEAGVPQAALEGLGNNILDLANKVGFSPTSLAEAMYHIESNGKGLLTAAQAMDQLKVSAEAAAMSGASLDDTTYTLSSTLASGITGAKGYADMMGILNGIVGAGDMKFQDLNAAVGTGFFATAAQFGITIQSMGAALATLTDNGESAEEAATRLRMSVTLMDAPSAQAAKVLGALGLSGDAVKASTAAATAELQAAHVTTTKLADDMRKPDGINVALQDLQSHLEASGLSADAADAAIAKAFGGGRSDAAILTLLNNTKRTGEAFDQINKTAGDFGNSWGLQQQTAVQQFKNAWAGIEADLVKLGQVVLPEVIPLMHDLGDAIQGVSDWFQNISPGMQQFVVDSALVAAAVGPILVLLGSFAKNVSAIMTLGKLFGIGSMFAGAAEGAAGVAGLGATLGAIAPLALALAPVLGAVAYGVHQQSQEAQQSADATANASRIIDKFGASQTLSAIYTNNLTQKMKNQKEAVDNENAAVVNNFNSTNNLNKANQDVLKAQSDVAGALQQYGQNSPQYQAAVGNLTAKQQAYRDMIHDASEKTLDLITSQGKLKDANKALQDATGLLNGYIKDQNKDLGDIVDTVAKMGPTADLQVKSIANLGKNIATVVAQFQSAQGQLQAGIASDIGNFQGLGSTIDRLQTTATNLQKTTTGLQVQGGKPSSMQGNYGTAPVPGVFQQHAAGGVFSTPHIGVVAEAGPEAIIPLGNPSRAQQVMREAGLSRGGISGGTPSIGSITANIFNEMDMQTFLRELSWTMANAN